MAVGGRADGAGRSWRCATPIATRRPGIRAAATRGDYRQAFSGIAALRPVVAKFFDDVLVMAEDEALRDGASAAGGDACAMLILDIADLSEMAAEA